MQLHLSLNKTHLKVRLIAIITIQALQKLSLIKNLSTMVTSKIANIERRIHLKETLHQLVQLLRINSNSVLEVLKNNNLFLADQSLSFFNPIAAPAIGLTLTITLKLNNNLQWMACK